MRLNLVIHRYEVILLMLVILLTGGITIVPTATEHKFPVRQRYPYSVALTFDDGPYPGYTERILEILREKDVRATFFVIGVHVEKRPELARLIVKEGHEIANHTYSHPNLTRLGKKEVLEELGRTRRLITDKTGIDSGYFRPPGGRINRRIFRLARENGYEPVLWTVLPRDHEPSVPEDILVSRVINGSMNEGIVCMHNGIDRTINALDDIIDRLRMKGFRFVTITELYREKELSESVKAGGV